MHKVHDVSTQLNVVEIAGNKKSVVFHFIVKSDEEPIFTKVICTKVMKEKMCSFLTLFNKAQLVSWLDRVNIHHLKILFVT